MHDLRQLVSDAGGTNPRLALASVKALGDELEWLLVRAVRLARAEGYGWASIGRLLGVSRQSARERFDRLAPLVGPIPPHLRQRSQFERYAQEITDTVADLRRRRDFEGDDPPAW